MNGQRQWPRMKGQNWWKDLSWAFTSHCKSYPSEVKNKTNILKWKKAAGKSTRIFFKKRGIDACFPESDHSNCQTWNLIDEYDPLNTLYSACWPFWFWSIKCYARIPEKVPICISLKDLPNDGRIIWRWRTGQRWYLNGSKTRRSHCLLQHGKRGVYDRCPWKRPIIYNAHQLSTPHRKNYLAFLNHQFLYLYFPCFLLLYLGRMPRPDTSNANSDAFEIIYI